MVRHSALRALFAVLAVVSVGAVKQTAPDPSESTDLMLFGATTVGGISERAGERVELCPNVAASDKCHVELKTKGDPALSVDAGAIHHVVLL